MIIPIDAPDDPRIAAYRNIRERDLTGREGWFIAEGEVVLRMLAGARGMRAVSLLLAAHRVARLGELIAAFDPEVPVYAAAQPVLDAIAGFHLHRGVLALGERSAAPDAETLLAGLGPQALVVALAGIGNHDNMGGIFRNAAAFGADAVLLDSGCCDPLYRKAIRVSVGGVLRTPFARLKPGADMVGLLERAGFEVLALSPSGAAPLREIRPALRTAVLLGAEGPGLAQDVLARTRTVTIPMAGGFDSLNVATTSGIVLHHLTRPA